MCFPFPGLLRHVIKHTLFDFFFFSLPPLNRSGCGNGVRGDVKEFDILERVKAGKKADRPGERISVLNTHGLRNEA